MAIKYHTDKNLELSMAMRVKKATIEICIM